MKINEDEIDVQLKAAIRKYKENLSFGGKPARVVATLYSMLDGLEWKVTMENVPQDMIGEFVKYIHSRIVISVKPPDLEPPSRN